MKKSDKISTAIFYFSIFAFIIGFNFQDNPPGGWYQQTLPDIGGRQISDIFFLDSLTGWAVTPYTNQNDTSYVLKTTNGGDNWLIQHTRIEQFVGSYRVEFLNSNTGFTAGVSDMPAYSTLLKTTNGGDNWFNITPPKSVFTTGDMSVLNEDTIWIVSENGLTGGVFRTTNGGVNWTQQHSGSVESIYMYNWDLGFYGTASQIHRTTNGGNNWTQVYSAGFTDMIFADSLTGWCSRGQPSYILKTTDGGVTWLQKQLPPEGGFFVFSSIKEFAMVNKDTIYGVNPVALTSSGGRGLIYMTEDGGETWGYQLPDKSINIFQYINIEVTDKNHIWAYGTTKGVHTKVGGDTVIYTSIHQINSQVPEDFILYQNYPNPFNPATKLKFDIRKADFISLRIFNIVGEEILILVNEELKAGTYQYTFDGKDLPSGIYFYQLKTGEFIDTKKMILIK